MNDLSSLQDCYNTILYRIDNSTTTYYYLVHYLSGINVDNDVGGGGMIGLGACGVAGIAAETGGGGIVPTMGDDIIGGTMGITDVVGIAPMVAGDSRLCF